MPNPVVLLLPSKLLNRNITKFQNQQITDFAQCYRIDSKQHFGGGGKKKKKKKKTSTPNQEISKYVAALRKTRR
jgi:hypothetical protein